MRVNESPGLAPGVFSLAYPIADCRDRPEWVMKRPWPTVLGNPCGMSANWTTIRPLPAITRQWTSDLSCPLPAIQQYIA
jgi:hypothetical protein